MSQIADPVATSPLLTVSFWLVLCLNTLHPGPARFHIIFLP
ncbi:DUF1145 domain-containing protein [Paenibacillaceae bacterium]|nr:DUF1145 domain-containing protein [Paenibacillaceae bacterium]